MLAHVTDEQHAILRTETLQKRVHVLRTRQAPFVEHVKPLLTNWPCFLLADSERSLQRVTTDRPFLHDGFAFQIAIARERH